jgi:hypothetical protein
MKKQFIIILLLFSIQLFAQKDPNPHFPKQKLSAPCNREFLDNYKGKWLVPGNSLMTGSHSSSFSQGAIQRINQIHAFVKQIYPQPMGSDAYWHAGYSKVYFADKIKYVTENDESRREAVTLSQVEGWRYNMGLSDWICSENANEMWNGYPDVGEGASITVEANNLIILNGEFIGEDGWTIDGRPIKKRMHVIGQWKGYDIWGTNGGYYADQNSDRYIMITRNGMLPYVPVTRKQYLERAIAYTTKFYDKTIAFADKIPDKEERDETKKRNSKDKNDAIRKLQDELEKTTRDGMLDSAAVIGTDPLVMNVGPIFLPDKDGGTMLVTDNPDYFRKDLPAYVPQLFVLSWTSNKEKWGVDFKKAIEENFPIEQLKAMIDK